MANLFDTFRDRLGYLLSLPERTIRSLAAMAGGTTTLLTDTLFPDALRGSSLYKLFIGDAQNFLITKVAQIQAERPALDELGATRDDYIQRKMIGGALETAGLFAMHFSPLWVFAIAADAAAGSNTFLQRLAAQLKANNVLPNDMEVGSLTELLEAVQDSSRRSATAIDTPPLSRAEIGQLADELTSSYKQVFASATNLLPRMEQIWGQMEYLSDRENISMERLTGILTVDTAEWARKGACAVLSVGQTINGLVGEKILDGYSRSLNTIATTGITEYFNQHMCKFMQAAANHFSPQQKTWTQSLLGCSTIDQQIEQPESTITTVDQRIEDPQDPPTCGKCVGS